jgi:hypothetical protein
MLNVGRLFDLAHPRRQNWRVLHRFACIEFGGCQLVVRRVPVHGLDRVQVVRLERGVHVTLDVRQLDVRFVGIDPDVLPDDHDTKNTRSTASSETAI